jgi:hypothetical protein
MRQDLLLKGVNSVRHYPSERLRIEVKELLRQQCRVLDSRMLGITSDDDLLEYEVRQDIVHELCKVLATSA